MILTNIELLNYKKYPAFTLEFEEGLTGIIGRNGSGKSTIFDAIIFALYGELRGQKEHLKNAKAGEKENVSVSLVFEIDAKTYRVVRELRGKSQVAKAALYHDDDVLLSEGAKEVTKSITKLVGMSRDAFMHTVFASQKELTALSGLKNEERKKIIRKLLGLEKIDKIEQEIRSELTDLNRDIKIFGEILLSEDEEKQINERKTLKTKEYEDISKELKALQSKHDEASKTSTSLHSAIQALQKLKEEHTKLHSDLSLLEQSKKSQTLNLDALHGKLKALTEQSQTYTKERAFLEQYTQLNFQIALYQKQAVAFEKKEGLEKEQVALRDAYRQAEKEITELKEKLGAKALHVRDEQKQKANHVKSTQKLNALEKQEQSLRAEIAKYQGVIDDTKQKVAKIESLGRESQCPTCTRALLDAYDEVIASLHVTINSIHTQEIQKRDTALKTLLDDKAKEQSTKLALEKTLGEISAELRVLQSFEQTLAQKEALFTSITQKGTANKKALEDLGELHYDKHAHTHALKTKEGMEARYKELIGIAKLIEQIPALENERKALALSLAQTQADIEKQLLAIKSHTYNEALHVKQNAQYDESLKAKDALAKSLRDQEKIGGAIKGEIGALQTKLDTNTRQKQQLQNKRDDKNDYEKLKLFMGEFKNSINAKIAPRISQLASEMYATITKGRYQHIEVNNEFDFFIYDEGERYGIERFSGGEIDLANLVLRIAISKTLSELSGSGGVGLLAFDEVFGSQDEERRFEIMEAFHTIKEQYRQIFLISHESEIKEMFERVVAL
jgi:exonuclease SbcC